MKEVLSFMAAFRASQEAWLSPEIEIPEHTDGFDIKHKKGIKGLVVFGSQYPLSNIDISIKDHLSVWKSIQAVNPLGVVSGNIYHSVDGQPFIVGQSNEVTCGADKKACPFYQRGKCMDDVNPCKHQIKN